MGNCGGAKRRGSVSRSRRAVFSQIRRKPRGRPQARALIVVGNFVLAARVLANYETRPRWQRRFGEAEDGKKRTQGATKNSKRASERKREKEKERENRKGRTKVRNSGRKCIGRRKWVYSLHPAYCSPAAGKMLSLGRPVPRRVPRRPTRTIAFVVPRSLLPVRARESKSYRFTDTSLALIRARGSTPADSSRAPPSPVRQRKAYRGSKKLIRFAPRCTYFQSIPPASRRQT